MALTASIVEQIAAWCATSELLADIRSKARSEYFGYDKPGEVHYMEGAGDVTSRVHGICDCAGIVGFRGL